jgi:putative glutathione S-transferase
VPAIKKSVNMQHIKLHYYASHAHMGLNPFGIVPLGPNVDFNLPHDRARFTIAATPPF